MLSWSGLKHENRFAASLALLLSAFCLLIGPSHAAIGSAPHRLPNDLAVLRTPVLRRSHVMRAVHPRSNARQSADIEDRSDQSDDSVKPVYSALDPFPPTPPSPFRSSTIPLTRRATVPLRC
jgi:hypothetical protein